MESKSVDISAADAVEHIEEFLTTAEEITAFIEGDTRKTVQTAAEARVAKLAGDKPPITLQAKETALAVAVDHDIWMYHKDQEPRLFRKGETIPDTGWSDTGEGILGVIWTHDGADKWVRIVKVPEKK